MIIKIEYFDDCKQYVAHIEGDDYKGIVVSENSESECLVELAKSLDALKSYKSSQQ